MKPSSSSQKNPAGKKPKSPVISASQPSSGEISPLLKNFRHHADIENFYRFIFENDLRLEAIFILSEVMAKKHIKNNI